MKKGKYAGHQNAALLIRYADDFVILHEDLTVVQKCQQILSQWLSGMGLELKPSKTRLAHTLNQYGVEKPGFDFLGFTIRQFPVGKNQSGKNCGSRLGFKTLIKPSETQLQIHAQRIGNIIDAHKGAPQSALIGKLNPVITGWASYYSTVVSKQAYSKQDHLMYLKLRAWAKSRHHNKPQRYVVNKYWHTHEGRSWIFASSQQGSNLLRLHSHKQTPIVRHVKVRGEASPYNGDWIYWSTRMGKHPEVTNTVATLLKKHKGKCAHCGLFFKDGDLLEVDHILPKSRGGRDEYQNLQLLHRHCHDVKTALDDQAGGLPHDKHQISEEPDEGKLSRPVLKPSRRGDPPA